MKWRCQEALAQNAVIVIKIDSDNRIGPAYVRTAFPN